MPVQTVQEWTTADRKNRRHGDPNSCVREQMSSTNRTRDRAKTSNHDSCISINTFLPYRSKTESQQAQTLTRGTQNFRFGVKSGG